MRFFQIAVCVYACARARIYKYI